MYFLVRLKITVSCPAYHGGDLEEGWRQQAVYAELHLQSSQGRKGFM